MIDTIDKILHIYTRVSTQNQQDSGTSLDTQLELGIKRAKELGFEYEIWDEGGRSSHHEEIEKRPKLSSLYNMIKDNKVKHLWVYDQSRLSRNDNVSSAFRYVCNKHSVTLYTKDGTHDLSNPSDMLLKQLLDAISQFDNASRTERTRLGKLKRVKEGFWHGGDPVYGYMLKDRKLVINPEESKWVIEIYKLYADGKSTSYIKNFLDSNGVPTRRQKGLWTLGSLQKILKNDHYGGSYSYSDKISKENVSVLCPMIVPNDVWDAVEKKRNRLLVRKNQINKTTRFYLLRDFLFCYHCKKPLAGRIDEKNHHNYYYCADRERTWTKNGGASKPYDRSLNCGLKKAINIEKTDKIVWDNVLNIHRKSSILKEEVKRRTLSNSVQSKDEISKELDAYNKKVKKLKKEHKLALDAMASLEMNYLLKKIESVTYKLTKEKLQNHADNILADLERLQFELTNKKENKLWINWLERFGTDVDNLQELDQMSRKSYLEGMVDKIEVKYDVESNCHELLVYFNKPIVDDSIEYVDDKKKSKGYKIIDGTNQLLVEYKKKLR